MAAMMNPSAPLSSPSSVGASHEANSAKITQVPMIVMPVKAMP